MHISKQLFPKIRMRRLRSHPQLRTLIQETQLSVNDFVLPLFVRTGKNVIKPITSMPGHAQLSLDHLKNEILNVVALGIKSVILFGIPEYKDELGSSAYDDEGIIQQASRLIKDIAPELLIIADCCFCEYTNHGHCGVIKDNNGRRDVDNDATLELLAKQAISLVRAGADVIAPSGMIDGMVSIIRTALDSEGFTHIPILSYSVKYASALYGPFREAAEGAPQFGDRRSYQMDPANSQEALREAALDIAEGADMLMIKPALAYLDILNSIKNKFPEIPIAAYQVSGEYAMIKAAGQNGWINEKQVILETLIAIKRAGAAFIISYFSKEVAGWLQER